MESPEDIAAEGRPHPDKPVLKGGGRQIVKIGGMAAANRDFDRLSPRNVVIRTGGIRVGRLADGKTLIVRPLSEPTLEIQEGTKPVFKIRYPTS